ncbi:MAG: VCBS repeat-containing protein [Bacteroidales bacterium]|nr:VCBS repeat-containing protein [Bacteroidales bacterium]
MNFEYIYNGAGVGIADLNNDNRPDIVFNGNQEAPRIYLNEGGFKFSDISSSFEDLDQGQWYSGVTFADINNDGWMDVYLTCTAYDEPEKEKTGSISTRDYRTMASWFSWIWPNPMALQMIVIQFRPHFLIMTETVTWTSIY